MTLSFVVTFIYASECKIRSTGEEYKLLYGKTNYMSQIADGGRRHSPSIENRGISGIP